MIRHYNIRIIGKVQGVWFRNSASKKAIELNVSGFVRNDPDGSVYIEAEGEEESLKSLIDWCWEGPPNARVEKVETIESELKGFSGFEITRF